MGTEVYEEEKKAEMGNEGETEKEGGGEMGRN
jgi:hypothetical protein